MGVPSRNPSGPNETARGSKGTCQLDSKCSACRHHDRVLLGWVMSPSLRLLPMFFFRCDFVAARAPEPLNDAGESFIRAELLTAPLSRSNAGPKDVRFAPHTSWLCTFGCSRFSTHANRDCGGLRTINSMSR